MYDPPRSEARLAVPSAVVLVVTALGSLLACELRLPGLDTESLLAQGFTAIGIPRALPALVLFGGLATLAPDVRLRRLWPALYAATVGLYAWQVALGLESMGWGMVSVVVDPGVGFRLITSASALGLGGLLWVAMQRAEATGGVRGVLWVAGTVMAVQLLAQMASGTVSWALGGVAPLGWWFTVMVVTLAVGTWAWLTPAPGVLRSGKDAALAPVVGAVTAATLTASLGPEVTRLATGLGAVVGYGVVVWQAVDRATNERSTGGLLALPLVPALAVAVSLAGLLGDPVAMSVVFEPGPFDGEVDASLVLAAAEPGPDDREVLAGRLVELGIEHQLQGAGGELQLTLEDVVGVDQVLAALLPRHRITFRAEVAPADADGTWEDCWDGGAQCASLMLGPPLLDSGDVADASVGWTQYGEPYVMLSFTPQGARVFADYTTGHVGQRFAVLDDGVVMMAPSIREPILGGRAAIQLGGDPAPALTAEALAAALRTPALHGEWTLAEVR